MKGHQWVGLVVRAAVAGALILGPARESSASARKPEAGADLETVREWNKIGRVADAERAARSLLRRAETESAGDSLGVAEVLDQLAISLRRGGKASDPEALQVCERALRIKRTTVGDRDPRYAASLQNLGMVHSTRGEYRQALPILEEALRIRERTLPPRHPDLAINLSAIAAARGGLGHDLEAAATMQRAVEIQRVALAPDDPDRAITLSGLAGLTYYLGDFSEAARLGEEAVEVLQRRGSPNSPILATCYHNLGGIYGELGDYDRAVDRYERALRIRTRVNGPSHVFVASTSMELGYALQALGRTKEALRLYLRAIEIYGAAGPAQASELGWARQKLGLLYLATGDPVAAKKSLQEALRLQEETLGAGSWRLWMTLRGLAAVSAREGDPVAARGYFERDIALLEASFGETHPDLATTLGEYAAFLLSAGDREAALQSSLRAARINEEHMRQTARGISERQGLLYGSTRATGLDVALAVVAEGGARPHAPEIRSVWDALIRQRTLVLDEVAARNREALVEPSRAGPIKDLERARRRLANLSVRGPAGESVDHYRASMGRARDEVERLEREIGDRSAGYRARRDKARVGFGETRASLPERAALVGFASYRSGAVRKYVALICRKRGGPVVVTLGRAAEIDSLVWKWRGAAAEEPAGKGRKAGDAERACRRIGERLRAVVWDPLEPSLTGTDRVFVVPEGALHLVNLTALPDSGGGYLIESPRVLHELTCERDLVSSGRAPRSGSGLLACGGPQFDLAPTRAPGRTKNPSRGPLRTASTSSEGTRRGSISDCVDFRTVRFQPLPGAAREIQEIAAAWPDPGSRLLLTGADATEGAVKANASGRRVIHLATHGFFLSGRCSGEGLGSGTSRGIGGIAPDAKRPRPARTTVDPLRLSGLAFAGANERGSAAADEEDGILTAEEISSLDLPGVEWAVLSACDTGLGDIQLGEGVLGLRRSFQAAGVGTVIMSLWAVEDEATRLWMKRLYAERFEERRRTADAVREASLGVLLDRRAHGRSTHPFYWAAFVATGDWN